MSTTWRYSGCNLLLLYDADSVADILAEDNPRFDRARFLKACEA